MRCGSPVTWRRARPYGQARRHRLCKRSYRNSWVTPEIQMGQHLIRRTAWNASRWIELLAWACGLLVMTSFAFSRIPGLTGRASDLQQFATMQSGAAFTVGLPDQHLWSPERMRAWHDAQKQPKATPLGVLRIRRIGLEVPILDGTDEWTLNRA